MDASGGETGGKRVVRPLLPPALLAHDALGAGKLLWMVHCCYVYCHGRRLRVHTLHFMAPMPFSAYRPVAASSSSAAEARSCSDSSPWDPVRCEGLSSGALRLCMLCRSAQSPPDESVCSVVSPSDSSPHSAASGCFGHCCAQDTDRLAKGLEGSTPGPMTACLSDVCTSPASYIRRR